MYIYSIQQIRKSSISYWGKVFQESKQRFFVIQQKVQQKLTHLCLKTSKYVFVFFRFLSLFLPSWLSYRLESLVGYVRYHMLQKTEELASIEHQRKIDKIHQEFSQKISQEKRAQSQLEKELVGLKDSFTEKEREKRELLRQIHEARVRASMLQVTGYSA